MHQRVLSDVQTSLVTAGRDDHQPTGQGRSPTNRPISTLLCNFSPHNFITAIFRINPSPPGLLPTPLSAWGGERITPLLSREPLVVESRARRHSKALYKTRQNQLSELNTRTGGGSENHTVWRGGAYNAPHRSQLL